MKSITMTADSVNAILAGRKSQTRRVADQRLFIRPHFDDVDGELVATDNNGDWYPIGRFAPHKVGDILYVKEAWMGHPNYAQGSNPWVWVYTFEQISKEEAEREGAQ